jgi:hypothetical protein
MFWWKPYPICLLLVCSVFALQWYRYIEVCVFGHIYIYIYLNKPCSCYLFKPQNEIQQHWLIGERLEWVEKWLDILKIWATVYTNPSHFAHILCKLSFLSHFFTFSFFWVEFFLSSNQQDQFMTYPIAHFKVFWSSNLTKLVKKLSLGKFLQKR